MYEIEFIGRGGQGAKSAAEIVARQAIKKGLFIQSFPDYGPERKGAPVRAFTRTSKAPIRGCSSEADPDIVVVIDPTLLSLNGSFFKLKDDAILLANYSGSPEKLKEQINFNGKIYTVNATAIALKYLKSPITNTTMLGALSKVSNYYTLEELEKEIRDEFARKLRPEIIEKNIEAANEAYNQVKGI
ncbi:MAG: pyruvate synthase [Candidatus Woesearchaeota archaeon]|nr:MAG: pyruvate synthase [Candidatus Woesearchaeota archaeon]